MFEVGPRDSYKDEWRDLINLTVQTHATQEGIAHKVDFHQNYNSNLFMSDFASNEERRPDVLWWMTAIGSLESLDEIIALAEIRTQDLYKYRQEIHEWVAGGGVLIFSGNVQP